MSNLPRKKLMSMYTTLYLLRHMEERMIQLALDGHVPGWLHSYLGEEAVSVGVISNLRTDDYVTGTHRGRGHALAKGVNLKKYVAEVLGRKDGTNQGRGGEMHLAAPEVGAMGASGIVGGFISTGVGLAFAAQYKGEDRVSVSFFGDGATNQGSFHESMNLAALWKLPVVFVCENNCWAEFTPQKSSMCIEDIASRAAAYGMPGVTVDGDDVLAVYRAAGEAIDRARKGQGPTLLECKTHRWLGHYVGDAQKYRPVKDIEAAREFDCVARYQNKLLQEGVLTEGMIQEIQEKVNKEIDEAVEFGKNSPPPDPKGITDFVYA